ncbi:MAG: outer membrane lipoprotein-sorting protein [Verrucomicrobiota bacterium]|nr:outer membrane lipoprotein-sorting protein [Limisphaera sp.]MDW8382961.1 outer membrane lipoprotein-sorting protein [Verrucomicrobiota bacterium]
MVPNRAWTNHAILEVRPARPAQPYQIPLQIAVFPTTSGWCTLYETQAAADRPAARLWIERANDDSPRFFESVQGPTGQWPAHRTLLEPSRRMLGFVGSDFAPADLGMEFVFWPEQRWIRSEMRRGQFCDVVESALIEPPPAGYARVRAWFDRGTGGLVCAEAYDASGRLVKEFLPRRFRKTNGRWEVTELEMLGYPVRSRSRLILEALPITRP